MIDEIGKMEMFSKTFIKLIDQMIAKVETQKFIFIATVPTKPLRLADKLKDLPFSRIFEVIFLSCNFLGVYQCFHLFYLFNVKGIKIKSR